MQIQTTSAFIDRQATNPADAEVPAGKRMTVTAERGAELIGLRLAIDVSPRKPKPTARRAKPPQPARTKAAPPKPASKSPPKPAPAPPPPTPSVAPDASANPVDVNPTN